MHGAMYVCTYEESKLRQLIFTRLKVYKLIKFFCYCFCFICCGKVRIVNIYFDDIYFKYFYASVYDNANHL